MHLEEYSHMLRLEDLARSVRLKYTMARQKMHPDIDYHSRHIFASILPACQFIMCFSRSLISVWKVFYLGIISPSF